MASCCSVWICHLNQNQPASSWRWASVGLLGHGCHKRHEGNDAVCSRQAARQHVHNTEPKTVIKRAAKTVTRMHECAAEKNNEQASAFLFFKAAHFSMLHACSMSWNFRVACRRGDSGTSALRRTADRVRLPHARNPPPPTTLRGIVDAASRVSTSRQAAAGSSRQHEGLTSSLSPNSGLVP